MADEQVIGQLKERVAFLEGLVMALVAKNEPSVESTAFRANNNSTNNVQLALAASDKTSEDRVAFLEKLVMSLVAKNDSSANPVASQADGLMANNAQSASADTTDTTTEVDASLLMKLPPELRIDILERVLCLDIANKPYGLTPALPLPRNTYTSKTRVPASFHVNKTLRTESVSVFLSLARARIDILDIETKKLQAKHQVLATALRSRLPGRFRPYESREPTYKQIAKNYKAMADLESSCRVLGEHFERR